MRPDRRRRGLLLGPAALREPHISAARAAGRKVPGQGIGAQHDGARAKAIPQPRRLNPFKPSNMRTPSMRLAVQNIPDFFRQRRMRVGLDDQLDAWIEPAMMDDGVAHTRS